MKTSLHILKITSALALTATIISLAFTNCAKVNFGATEASKAAETNGTFDDGDDGDDDVVVTPTPPPVDEAIKNCAEAIASGKILSSNQTMEFKDTQVETGRQRVCEFGVNDNLAMKNNYLQARHEQTQALNLPAGAVICAVEMKTAIQRFKYDDVFFLTFNNRILASNLQRSVVLNSVEPMPLTTGEMVPLYSYDWLKVRGSSFAGVNETANDYCLGAKEGKATCQWPLSQQNGNIQFTFNPEMLINIGLKANSADQKFGFTISGDDDPTVDCYHEKLSFDTTIRYYIQK